MMPILALGVLVFGGLLFSHACGAEEKQADDHQVIPFPSERKRRWKKLSRASMQNKAERKSEIGTADNVIFLSSAKVAQRR